jgi:hypothetical protein
LQHVIACDPIEPTPFIEEYFKHLQNEPNSKKPTINAVYLKEYSTSAPVARVVDGVKPDFVFVDGDHSFRVAFEDHMLAREYAKIIVHHDVDSQACPDISRLWSALKILEGAEFDFAEFVDQYPSVNGNFLGIGAMKRRT